MKQKKNSVGLIFEGGGMRSLYGAGVIDFFLEQKISFDYVMGVSAGAGNAASYLSQQHDRARRVVVEHVQKKEYMGLYAFLKTGEYFNLDFIYEDIPKKIFPYDFSAYQKFLDQRKKFIVVVTNIQTGQAEYLLPTATNLLPMLRASASLPLIAKTVTINSQEYLDGGIADAIPFQKAFDDGCTKLVLCLTQPRGYRKKNSRMNFLLQGKYQKKYPHLFSALKNRSQRYNAQLDKIDALEQEGKVFVFAPQAQAGLKRVQRNIDTLNTIYQNGYDDANQQFAALQKFLSQ